MLTACKRTAPSPPHTAQTLICPSRANSRTDTFDGIDACGQRLVREIQELAVGHPSLRRITVCAWATQACQPPGSLVAHNSSIDDQKLLSKSRGGLWANRAG